MPLARTRPSPTSVSRAGVMRVTFLSTRQRPQTHCDLPGGSAPTYTQRLAQGGVGLHLGASLVWCEAPPKRLGASLRWFEAPPAHFAAPPLWIGSPQECSEAPP